jgi:transcriptional regulator with XRE-family HTH domain
LRTIGDRLRDARLTLGLSQTAFAESGGVQKGAQIKYEAGDRYPDAAYLAAVARLGVDVRYVITGDPGSGAFALSDDERALLEAYRAAPALGQEYIRRCAGVQTSTPPIRYEVGREATPVAVHEGNMAATSPLKVRRGGVEVIVHGDVGQAIKGGVHAPQTVIVGGNRVTKK